MDKNELSRAIGILQNRFSELDWTYHDAPLKDGVDKMYKWPGDPSEEVIICVHKSSGMQELFHRHDFFFFNYTYRGQYSSLSRRNDNTITICEHELYAGQPFAAHALHAHDNAETIIVGILIQKKTFFHSFLPLLTANFNLLHFLLDPALNSFSDECIHFKIDDSSAILPLIELMIAEYARRREDTQNILKPLVLSFLSMVARQYSHMNMTAHGCLGDRLIQYIAEHVDTVSLKELSRRFQYHPNYISNILSKEKGRTFSQIRLEQRMTKALVLLKNSTLAINEVALMLGYSNSSNFYREFKRYYGKSPREYMLRP
ncbi:MAG: helix-turn-helix transcriptional regulator [Desulfovibrionaceae bacterium]|nr:helix-turn-helix transcriptional regulator [Desulfovibrionaceae bacterium]